MAPAAIRPTARGAFLLGDVEGIVAVVGNGGTSLLMQWPWWSWRGGPWGGGRAGGWVGAAVCLSAKMTCARRLSSKALCGKAYGQLASHIDCVIIVTAKRRERLHCGTDSRPIHNCHLLVDTPAL